MIMKMMEMKVRTVKITPTQIKPAEPSALSLSLSDQITEHVIKKREKR
jgi:hypothetical protein